MGSGGSIGRTVARREDRLGPDKQFHAHGLFQMAIVFNSEWPAGFRSTMRHPEHVIAMQDLHRNAMLKLLCP